MTENFQVLDLGCSCEGQMGRHSALVATHRLKKKNEITRGNDHQKDERWFERKEIHKE